MDGHSKDMTDLAIEYEDEWDIQILVHEGKERGLQDESVFQTIIDNPRPLIIIPDAGTNDKAWAEKLEELNIDLLVLDHHDIETPVNSVNSVLINNQNPLNNNISKNGSGCLVTYMFLKALDWVYGRNEADEYIDLVALSLISDSMDMSDQQNRTFYHYGP